MRKRIVGHARISALSVRRQPALAASDPCDANVCVHASSFEALCAQTRPQAE
jgi:hypothetical protein